MRLFWLMAACAAPDLLAQTLHWEGAVRSGRNAIPGLRTDRIYVLAVSGSALAANDSVRISLESGGKPVIAKTLHAGDWDLTSSFRVSVPAATALVASGSPIALRARITSWPGTAELEAEPNNNWNEANPIALGDVIFGSADDAPYIPVAGTSALATKKAVFEQAPDWFRFEFNASKPKLVYFQLELMERDNVPVDVAVFRVVNGKTVAFNEGEDPVALPHEVQAMQGNKFTTRVLKEQGTYYVRVIANHPEYKLRTRVYDAPPYADPQQAVRTALDYLLGAGDSWHANTPRRGGVYDRVSAVHQETSLCVACHVTHFTSRAQLYATRLGYPVVQRQQLQFLMERFYNNPRPLYGFETEGAVWARVISAPANVLGRMSHLLDVYEKEVTHERRERFHRGVGEYLKLYYQDRTKLPPNETNGNLPLVSAYEVAWYAWEATKDPAIAKLVEGSEIKDLIDLCYQTQAFVSIDKIKYAERINRNVERLLSLQRPDGQWSMKFDPKEKAVEFQTGHVLWTLAMAGVPRTNPQVAKGLAYLLGRQQDFGGWLDPLQSFENFRTPFRETQMAALALASYYPGPAASAAPLAAGVLKRLDATWSTAPGLEQQARSADPFLRQAAVEALGRLGAQESQPLFTELLGDSSKLVQRTAAWALRQIQSRRRVDAAVLAKVLDSPDARTRWAATRVFATHFSALTESTGVAAALTRRLDDQPSIRHQAVKGLWQFWFWTPDSKMKESIEANLLTALTRPQHPWVEQSLREAIYNLADENIRYLYNNWVPLISRAADQEKVIRGRLAIEARLAERFASFLDRESDANRKRLLAALVELPLRRADIYDPAVDHATGFAPIYNRIGNDVEQSVFFGDANTRFAKSLVALLQSKDPEVRRLAISAGQLTRDARFGAVTALAGKPGPEREHLVAAAREDIKQPDNAELLKAFNAYPRPPMAARGGARRSGAARPDEAFFRGYVEPIFNRRGKDGQACIHCHSTHSIFNATLSTVFNVVNLEDPEESLLLKKPTWDASEEGTLGAKSHGGGVRFEKDSPEYNTILNWLRGVKE